MWSVYTREYYLHNKRLVRAFCRLFTSAHQLAKYSICKQRNEQKKTKENDNSNNSSSNNHTTITQRKKRKKVYKLQAHTTQINIIRIDSTNNNNQPQNSTHRNCGDLRCTNDEAYLIQVQINTLNFQRKTYTNCFFCVFCSFHPANTTHSLSHSLSVSCSDYHRLLSIRHCLSIKSDPVCVWVSVSRFSLQFACVNDDVLSAQNHFYYQVICTICSQIQLIKLTHICTHTGS